MQEISQAVWNALNTANIQDTIKRQINQAVMVCYMLCLSPSRVCYRHIPITKHLYKEEHKEQPWFTTMRGKDEAMIPVLNEWDRKMLNNFFDIQYTNWECSSTVYVQAPPLRVYAKLREAAPKIYSTLGKEQPDLHYLNNLWRLRYEAIVSYGVDTQWVKALCIPYKKLGRGVGLLPLTLLAENRMKIIKAYDYSFDF